MGRGGSAARRRRRDRDRAPRRRRGACRLGDRRPGNILPVSVPAESRRDVGGPHGASRRQRHGRGPELRGVRGRRDAPREHRARRLAPDPRAEGGGGAGGAFRLRVPAHLPGYPGGDRVRLFRGRRANARAPHRRHSPARHKPRAGGARLSALHPRAAGHARSARREDRRDRRHARRARGRDEQAGPERAAAVLGRRPDGARPEGERIRRRLRRRR